MNGQAPPGLGTELVTPEDFVCFRLRKEPDVCLELCKPSGAPSERDVLYPSRPKPRKVPWRRRRGRWTPDHRGVRTERKPKASQPAPLEVAVPKARAKARGCGAGRGGRVLSPELPAQLLPFPPPDFGRRRSSVFEGRSEGNIPEQFERPWERRKLNNWTEV